MNDSEFSRRRFLVASIVLSGIAGGMRAAGVFAQGAATRDAQSLRTLGQLARRLYPHAAIADEVYAEVIIGALDAAAGDATLSGALDAAETALDTGQDGTFIELDEAAQTRALEALESTPYFAAIQASVLAGVYNHPAVWELVGYGGPSWRQGGYLNRGAGEIDWLEETD